MKINGIKYKILKKLYRTRGSENQLLTASIPGSRIIEDRRTFYIVEKDGEKFFVKEYSDPDYGSGELGYPENIGYEHCVTSRLKGEITYNSHNIDVPMVFERDGNKLLFEYLSGYEKLNKAGCMKWLDKQLLVDKLVKLWLMNKRVEYYDLCANNTMVRLDGNKLSVRLIDFEYSSDRDPKKEFGIKE